MLKLAILFYGISLTAQLVAACIAISLIKKANVYRVAWIFLSAALILMLGRRISPIVFILGNGEYNMTDALLSIPISIFLMVGIWGVRKILIFSEQANKNLSEINKVDYLTKALSRIELYSRSELEVDRALRYKKDLAFVMVDIDHFKKINDQYGHAVGDEVLKSLVLILKNCLRKNDFIGRIGGEEFLIVLPEANSNKAIEVAERLRERVASQNCYNFKNKSIKITISLGVSIMSSNETSKTPRELVEEHFNNADIAMYKAKNTGRNRVVAAEDLPD